MSDSTVTNPTANIIFLSSREEFCSEFIYQESVDSF